ncbi:MAG: IS30 family transposase [Oscillospiraceae bacterium]|nr:IS30 family transposase [Oscillospiraceae bacterium]
MGQEHHNTEEGKWKQISEKERYKIEALYQQGLSAVEIGRSLSPKRDRRTIEREIRRGLILQRKSDLREELVYLADAGQRVHDEKASNKGRGLKIGHDHELAKYLEQKIGEDKWSPDAAIGFIKAQSLQFSVNLCTKTVYNYIDKGIFLGISNNDLWVKKDGVKRGYKKIRTVALNNKNGKSITERPKEVDERTEQGHWEIDLVVGKQGTKPAILTLVERKSRKSLYVLVKNKTQKEVVAAIKRARRRVGGNFSEVFKTITADNGSEFLDSDAIKEAAKCDEVYYAHPYSSWERGSNENGNRILRRFVPKGTDIGKLTSIELQRIEDWVNNYPRRILGYKSANQMTAC